MRKQKNKILEQEFTVLKPLTMDKPYIVGSTIKLSNEKQIEYLKINKYIK